MYVLVINRHRGLYRLYKRVAPEGRALIKQIQTDTVAEKGHPPRVGAGPAAGSVGYGRDPPRVASGMGGTRRGEPAAAPAPTRLFPRRVPPIPDATRSGSRPYPTLPAAGPAPTRGG